MKTKNIIFAAALLLVLSACKTEFTAPVATNGSANFSHYVAIGNSITSGYADGALYADGQRAAYPNLLAEKFKLAGGGDFTTPLMPEGDGLGIVGAFAFRGKMSLKVVDMRSSCEVQSNAPVKMGLSPVTSSLLDPRIYFKSVGGGGRFFNNMGVPGAKSFHIPFPGYGARNPFFGRFASDANTSILSDALAQNPTFFSLWIGNNDVLLYAASGAAVDSITPTGFFDFSINNIVKAMVKGNAKGVIANIPDVTALPYFTTVPYNGLMLSATQAIALNTGYKGSGINFTAGANGFIIADPSAPGKLRQIQAGELVLLSIPQDSIKCAGWGSLVPIPNQYVLTNSEISAIKSAISNYNTTLKNVAEANGLAFVDANSFLTTLKSSISYNGVSVSATYIKGGAFSLDGIHLTPLGNALVANQFLLAINAKYNSTLPLYDVSSFKGVVFP